MRRLIILALAAPTLACAARAPAASSLAQCPFRVQATITNPRPIDYDVYYRDPGQPAVVLGEVRAGSTVTFQLPGEGRGTIRLQRPAGDQQIIPFTGRRLPDMRIRTHCAGT